MRACERVDSWKQIPRPDIRQGAGASDVRQPLLRCTAQGQCVLNKQVPNQDRFSQQQRNYFPFGRWERLSQLVFPIPARLPSPRPTPESCRTSWVSAAAGDGLLGIGFLLVQGFSLGRGASTTCHCRCFSSCPGGSASRLPLLSAVSSTSGNTWLGSGSSCPVSPSSWERVCSEPPPVSGPPTCCSGGATDTRAAADMPRGRAAAGPPGSSWAEAVAARLRRGDGPPALGSRPRPRRHPPAPSGPRGWEGIAVSLPRPRSGRRRSFTADGSTATLRSPPDTEPQPGTAAGRVGRGRLCRSLLPARLFPYRAAAAGPAPASPAGGGDSGGDEEGGESGRQRL